uniref:Uncharacterized protein n=1 Tax=uncultured Myxococcales bacterium TaxID=253830 RepID=G3D5G2_9BACT|nr:hypothetical protein MMCf1_170 [uncultured Myxococcales bacterium]
MPQQPFLKGIQAYWDALGQPGQPPELGESRIDAFVDLLHVTSSAAHGFRLLETLESTYAGMAVGDSSRPWRLHWALQVGEVEPFIVSDLDGLIFLADTIADPEGKHRVYTLKDGMRGDLEFADLTDALRWMTAQVRHAKGELDDAKLQDIQSEASALLDDEWEKGPTSALYIVEELLDTPLFEAWDAISRGQWPLVESDGSKASVDREDGWQRRLSLWLTRRFLATRSLELPEEIGVSDMDAIHRSLVDHLIDFEQAIHAGDVPRIVDQAAAGEDAKLAKMAVEWVERHDSWRTAASVPAPDEQDDYADEPPPFQHTPFTRKLLHALSGSLDRMVEQGELELDPDRKDALLIELVTAGSDARSIKHMLKKLTATLVDSEHVEEIYPSDGQIQDRLKEDLGG